MSHIEEFAKNKILVLDGAMGTMIQALGLSESDFRGTRFAAHDKNLAGCNDLLCLTRPDDISGIHRRYLEAGADIIETNSFNSNAISLADYGLESLARELSREAARIARHTADAYTASTGRKVFVAGSIGPTNKSLTMAVSLGDTVTWDEMTTAYRDQIAGLIEGGVDLLLIETIFDTLNAKSAIFAAESLFEETGREIPVILSVTLTESGRTLSGQTLEAFVASTAHCHPFAVGLNCGFGPEGMKEYIAQLQPLVKRVSAYANAGLPDKLGRYTETPQMMADAMEPMLASGQLNIVGGCCGTTPDHIRLLAECAARYAPRLVATPPAELILAGLETLEVSPRSNFINIGERCNVAGSRKFLRLISEGNMEEAVETARTQVNNGAQIVDVNMDDGMLDSRDCISRFISLTQVDPEVARVPLMVDSSDFSVIEAGLQRIQGKPIVNSISLKEGEEKFIAKARAIKRYGAAIVVMAFDEEGQAVTFKRKTEICNRSYKILTEQCGIAPTDIIFDPNILAVATGIAEHSRYALDFLKAIDWIKANLPGAKISGGLSNLSFSFRGNEPVRRAMHSLFLSLAIPKGMDMAIVNAAALPSPDEIPADLTKRITDVLLDTYPGAADSLVEAAIVIMEQKDKSAGHAAKDAGVQQGTPAEQLTALVAKGKTAGLDETMDKVLAEGMSPVEVINGPLMDAMNHVGELFGQGRIFLPQVVKAAAAMKAAVDHITPLIEADASAQGTLARRPRMVVATVKGDVHDIGKNIVSVIMRCNGFDVIDLGTMVPADRIIEAAIGKQADAVGLSGLITPSLEEMCHVARLMESHGLKTPLFVGGATTSELHTALKIAPLYSGAVIHGRDAAQMPGLVRSFTDQLTAQKSAKELNDRYQTLRDKNTSQELLPYDDACKMRFRPDFSGFVNPMTEGVSEGEIPVSRLIPLINFRAFLAAWHIDASLASAIDVIESPDAAEQWITSLQPDRREKGRQALSLLHDALDILKSLQADGYHARYRITVIPAASAEGSIMLRHNEKTLRLPVLRRQLKPAEAGGQCLSLSDFIKPIGADGTFEDLAGVFAVTTGQELQQRIDELHAQGKEYESLVLRSVTDRLAEAATEFIHSRTVNTGIRPAVGYPSLPDQSLAFVLDSIAQSGHIGMKITETGALYPAASTLGLFISLPESRYFVLGPIGSDQREIYLTGHPLRGTIHNLERFLR